MTPRRISACLVLALCCAALVGPSAAKPKRTAAAGATSAAAKPRTVEAHADKPAVAQPAPLPAPHSAPPSVWQQTSTNPSLDRDPSTYLPDSALLATVGYRTIRVRRYLDSYFGSWPEFRPKPDSAGRVEFLNNLIKKEILGLVAAESYHDETFEERIQMREHTDRVLSNVLYQRLVYDSIHVDEADARKSFSQYGYELHLRRLVFRDSAVAARVRERVAKGRMTWTAAAAEQGIAAAAGLPEGDMGWVKRQALDPQISTTVFDLEPGQVSPVLFEVYGFTVYQAAGKRAVTAPAYVGIRTLLLEELKQVDATRRSEEMLARLRARTGLTHDTANILWATRIFPEVMTSGGPGGSTFEVDTRVPEFDPADTSRVLARFPDRTFTLGQFLTWYGAQSPYTRVSANTFPALRRQVDIAAMEPSLAVVARERGLDRDPLAVDLIGRRREELRVERLYQDSVASHVLITPKERRDYYQKNLASFLTYARVRYARIHRETRGEADSIATLLRAGASAEAIVIADSVAGRPAGTVQWRGEQEHGTAYQKLLFGLRPGAVTVESAPDGHFDVLQSVEFDPGHQLTYEQSEMMIDESLQNMAAERRLDELIERHKRRMRVEAHPELVMRIRLIDPTL